MCHPVDAKVVNSGLVDQPECINEDRRGLAVTAEASTTLARLVLADSACGCPRSIQHISKANSFVVVDYLPKTHKSLSPLEERLSYTPFSSQTQAKITLKR